MAVVTGGAVVVVDGSSLVVVEVVGSSAEVLVVGSGRVVVVGSAVVVVASVAVVVVVGAVVVVGGGDVVVVGTVVVVVGMVVVVGTVVVVVVVVGAVVVVVVVGAVVVVGGVVVGGGGTVSVAEATLSNDLAVTTWSPGSAPAGTWNEASKTPPGLASTSRATGIPSKLIVTTATVSNCVPCTATCWPGEATEGSSVRVAAKAGRANVAMITTLKAAATRRRPSADPFPSRLSTPIPLLLRPDPESTRLTGPQFPISA
jgi:hypothetical protein